MEWQDEYSVGIREIDDQHKALLHDFSRIEAAIRTGQEWGRIHFCLLELKHRARSHFDFEAGLMRLYGYAGVAEHIEHHQHCLDELEELERQSADNQVGERTIEFLLTWLSEHILGIDRDYAEYILAGPPVIR